MLSVYNLCIYYKDSFFLTFEGNWWLKAAEKSVVFFLLSLIFGFFFF